MEYIKIYPENNEKINGRKVIYTMCKATPEDISNQYRNNNSKRKSTGAKIVNCIGLKSDMLVSTYESVTEAAQKTGLDASNISKACRGDIPSLGGYKWQYQVMGENT